MYPPGAKEGDTLVVLVGGKTLYCLRPIEKEEEEEEGKGREAGVRGYLFVGECYVHGGGGWWMGL